jgi:hypothetical protein
MLGLTEATHEKAPRSLIHHALWVICPMLKMNTQARNLRRFPAYLYRSAKAYVDVVDGCERSRSELV